MCQVTEPSELVGLKLSALPASTSAGTTRICICIMCLCVIVSHAGKSNFIGWAADFAAAKLGRAKSNDITSEVVSFSFTCYAV